MNSEQLFLCHAPITKPVMAELRSQMITNIFNQYVSTSVNSLCNIIKVKEVHNERTIYNELTCELIGLGKSDFISKCGIRQNEKRLEYSVELSSLNIKKIDFDTILNDINDVIAYDELWLYITYGRDYKLTIIDYKGKRGLLLDHNLTLPLSVLKSDYKVSTIY